MARRKKVTSDFKARKFVSAAPRDMDAAWKRSSRADVVLKERNRWNAYPTGAGQRSPG
jgi:hypothetical protein